MSHGPDGAPLYACTPLTNTAYDEKFLLNISKYHPVIKSYQKPGFKVKIGA